MRKTKQNMMMVVVVNARGRTKLKIRKSLNQLND